jgi:UDPglucose--hexose-1-phosphate uridylyltransferase
MMDPASRASAAFRKQFGPGPRWLASAPGRVNLIGEFTDFNDGYVLPMAIERRTVIAAAPNGTHNVVLHSEASGETVSIDLTEPLQPEAKGQWSNYPKGVIAGFLERGIALKGFDAVIASSVPIGAGLSSSAALETAMASLLEVVSGVDLEPVDKILLCQKAEHDYAGVPCGIMDQFISATGRAGEALLLDCRSLEPTWVAMNDPAVAVLIINTNVKHELSSSGYADKRRACERAAQVMGVPSLRDATLGKLGAVAKTLDEMSVRCARHVICEIDRTRQAAEYIRHWKWDELGRLMYESHASLRDDYAVSCMELDAAVEIAREIGRDGGVFGCRMTGGGFGGCAVALIETSRQAELIRKIGAEYKQRTGREGTLFVSRAAQGANTTEVLDQPHRRFNFLTGEWIFVSPHRNKRPWQGRMEPAVAESRPAHDPQCYLCPGNVRANGERNPSYESTYVFTNDFPTFLPDTIAQDASQHPLLQAELHAGTCKVVCFSPRHDLTLAQMSVPEIRAVIDTWADEVTQLGRRWRWVQVFENKGEIMGCSNPHPHGQIWASDFIPTEPARELAEQQRWSEANSGKVLLLEYAAIESEARDRVIVKNTDWIAVVPWWAFWPFETLLLPRHHVQSLADLTTSERDSLAAILSQVLKAYDNLFATSFPYSFGWHAAPFPQGQLHAHFYPPLLRSATVKKFVAGYELFGELQRDISPEQAAERLRQALGGRSTL